MFGCVGVRIGQYLEAWPHPIPIPTRNPKLHHERTKNRFKQLEVADALRMWNEGFRIVEDIYTLMQIPVRQPDGSLARRQPKPRLMASYYDKMAKIFAVADNKLFHAYAWHKYYSLTK